MADAAVEFLLENLQQLLLYHANLIGNVKDQVEKLDNDLRFFNSFLKVSTRKRRKDDCLRELVRQIRDVVYDAEDIIDEFVTQAAERESKSRLRRTLQKPLDLVGIAKNVEKISAKVRDIYGDKGKFDFAGMNMGDGGSEEIEAPIVRQENMIVGFEDEAAMLFSYLKEETEKLDVISIIGMPGLGKTTLAGKIFQDERIQYEFPTRIWVYISQEFSKKNIFLAILREFTGQLTDDVYRKTDSELARLVASRLDKAKFLIVMDDVWTNEDWGKLQDALPMSNKMGKVLITSRHEEVARHANRSRNPHKLRFLNEKESWLLLQQEVFGKRDGCPPELEVPGKAIAKQCGGLPLALVVIGGILVKKSSASEEMSAKKKAWEKVETSVGRYLSQDPLERMEKIISLSYYKLPFHLRACFLYFGMFPEDSEIPVWKLIRMWIAEGFIQQKTGADSLEETAEDYLEDLISRNLVRIDKRNLDGKAKTCRIHDMLRDFCKLEAGNERENFFQEMKKSSEGFDPLGPDLDKYRRICIHSNISDFFSLKPHGKRVRSFVCFSKEDINLPAEYSSSIPAGFKLVRVLDVKPLKFSKIPSDLYHLVHLRYIILSFNLSVLPKSFDKLWNIQTLIVDTTSSTLEIKADIWKLMQLRYLKANASTTLPKPDNSSKVGQKLQTLGTIAPQSCTGEVFAKAPNLKKLGIRGRLSTLLGSKGGSFDSLGKLRNLEKLKLLNDVFPDPPSVGKLPALPLPYQFPKTLKSLTLAATHLDWSQMSVLALLDNLEVLKLKERAFMGKSWVVVDECFRKLEVLNIGRTDLVVWDASWDHFPVLRQLELHNCEELTDLPVGLADIRSLKLLKVHRSKSAAAAAKKICDARVKKMEDKEQTTKFSVLKLSIFPPDELK